MGLLEQPSISKRDAAGAIPGGYCTGGVGVRYRRHRRRIRLARRLGGIDPYDTENDGDEDCDEHDAEQEGPDCHAGYFPSFLLLRCASAHLRPTIRSF